jgi:aspartyl aminopeptidase
VIVSLSVFLIVDRNVNESLKFNQETEFVPILGQVASQLNSSQHESFETGSDSTRKVGEVPASSIQAKHHPALLSLLASELSIKAEAIHDFEL